SRSNPPGRRLQVTVPSGSRAPLTARLNENLSLVAVLWREARRARNRPGPAGKPLVVDRVRTARRADRLPHQPHHPLGQLPVLLHPNRLKAPDLPARERELAEPQLLVVAHHSVANHLGSADEACRDVSRLLRAERRRPRDAAIHLIRLRPGIAYPQVV